MLVVAGSNPVAPTIDSVGRPDGYHDVRIGGVCVVTEGIFYVCATPIGNLGDVSERLVATLKSVHHILCEDTRVTRTLLQRYDITTPTVSCNQFQETQKVDWILNELIHGHSLALVSDAGTPGICDPGYRVVSVVRAAGYPIQVIPGPSALASMLSISGLSSDRFVFCGFVPKRASDWESDCKMAQANGLAVVFFETPHRIRATLEWLNGFDSTAVITIGKELTKIFEKVFSGNSEQLLSIAELESPRGEWCGVVQFSPVEVAAIAPIVLALKKIGLSNRHVVDVSIKILHINKNKVYRECLRLDQQGIPSD